MDDNRKVPAREVVTIEALRTRQNALDQLKDRPMPEAAARLQIEALGFTIAGRKIIIFLYSPVGELMTQTMRVVENITKVPADVKDMVGKIMPGPDTVSIAKSCKLEIAFTGSLSVTSSLINEPGSLLLWVFFISHGTPAFAHGTMVLGCKTLAPK